MRKQDLNAIYQVCVFGPIWKQDGRSPGLWLADTFLTSPLKLLNGIQRNLTGSKISTSSSRFVFFGPIGTPNGRPGFWLVETFFIFFSETTERNLTNIDRKQNLNILYQVCVFQADLKTKMAARPLIGWHFRLLLWNHWTEINETWREDFNILLQVCDFRADRKTKMTAPASDWLRHFRLFHWINESEFNEKWQEGKAQRPLPSLCFSSRSKKPRWPSRSPIRWDMFDLFFWDHWTEFKILDRKPGLNVVYRVCFSCRSENQDGIPGRSFNRGGALYSGAHYVFL